MRFIRFTPGVCLLASSLILLAGGAVHWSYEGEAGPTHWGSLSPEYIACAEGMRQSPIDIPRRVPAAEDVAELEFAYADEVTLDVINNGHTIQANVPNKAGTLSIGGKSYALRQFHFHTPSEHLIDGQEFPMEMHLVHASAEGELAVLGIFLEIGDAHEVLAPVFTNIPGEAGTNHWVRNFELEELVPDDAKTYRYAGSLTTPPCSEGVRWHVATEPVSISTAQFQAFARHFTGSHFPDGNRRPVQPLDGRKIVLAED